VAGEAAMRRPGSDRIEIRVRATAASAVVVREAWAPGWTAQLDGRPAPVWLADGRHLAVRVPGGSSRVLLEYTPPSRAAAVAVSAAAAALVAMLAWRSRGVGSIT
jgi:uncharacterized membrane protein YfhO